MSYPQTIQIFLPSGDPQGIRIAAITTRILQVFEVPRVQLNTFLSLPEAEYVGVYVLFGSNEETGNDCAYIGQSGKIGSRLKQHNEKKDFWDRALIAISLTKSMTVTHAHFLEWIAIQQANTAARFELENGKDERKPHTPAPMEAECREIFDTFDILLTTLGFPLFKPLLDNTFSAATDLTTSMIQQSPVPSSPSGINLFLKGGGVDASARYTEEGVVVRKGSYGRRLPTNTFAKTVQNKKREKMIEEGVLRIDHDKLFFEKDLLFRSPSTAAIYIFGRSANGWIEWKNLHGETLSKVMGRDLKE